MDGDCGKNPFPPFYSIDEFIWSTPFVYGPTLLLSAIIAFAAPRHYHNINKQPTNLSAWSKFIAIASLIVSITLIFDSIVLVTRAIVEQFWTSTVLAYYIAVSWFSWSLCIITLITEAQSNHNKWYWVQYAFWFLAVAMETIVGWYWLRGITKHLPGTVFTIYDYFFLGVFITRYIVEWIIFVLSIIHLSKSRPTVAESSPLLVGSTTVYSQQQHQYGSTKMTTITTTITRTESAFSGSIRNMKKLLPFIWPHNNLKLQLCVLLSFFTIGLGLAVNLLVPFKIGRIVDDLRDGQFSWLPIVAYIGFKSLQGDTGLFQSIQNWLWAPISQHITQDVSLKVFSHLHISSVGFHTNRKTGEVQRVMEQGANSVVSLLHQILFQIFPIWANIILVSFFAAYIYAPAFGLLIFVAAMFYMNVTIAATERMAEYDQNIVELDKNTCTRAASSLANVETVKCYNAENFEHARYKDAIVSCQQADRKSSASLNTLNLIQNAIITGSLLSGSLWIGYQVSIGQLESGDFVAFNIYMMQIFTPLHHIGTHYRMVQTNFIRMEKMLTFLQEDQTIKDTPNAKELQVSQGHVVFDNVTFAQRERQNALNGISFSIPKGATVAFVGPASGGKSAVLRLLFRFHDPLSGHIYIDGQDIGQVTQSSLRKNIGIMPKDTVLFNESIYYNIHYGNVNADESQVKMAAKAAQFHDKIESFPDGYETKVGEQGLCLTTSDKQRIAIARTFLKNAPIILLDTSALDVTTEGRTLQALSSMTKDRTTLIVTHRLASVVNADLIFVVKDGMVVEKGSHQQLMEKTTAINGGGIYYKMWQKQIHDDSDSDDDYFFEDKTNSKQIQYQNDSDNSTSTIDDQKLPTHQKTHTRSLQQQPTRNFSVQVIEVERDRKRQPPKREIQIIEVEEEVYVSRSTASHTVETIEIEDDIYM